MYRGTTPTLFLELDTELVFDNLSEMWVTFKSPSVEITKTLSEVTFDSTTNKIIVSLSQEETLQFFKGVVEVQVRLLTESGLAYATTIENVDVGRILKEGVI